MQQHPIPQQISSYEFRLVGDMTLKQFLKFSAGLLLAVIIYKFPGLAIYFRVPLAGLVAFLGAVSAFMPIYDRPLESWLLAFLRSAYSPTLFLWKRQVRPAPIQTINLPPPKTVAQKVKTVNKSPAAKEFLASLPSTPPATTPHTTKRPTATASPPPPEKKDTAPLPAEEALEKIQQTIKEKPPTVTASPTYEEAPMPATPTTHNIVSGIVLDENGKTIEGAIVEIQDIEGNPIRAMRTNSLGQFQTATPLPKGDYLVIAEKEPYQFDIIKLPIKGEIVPPIKIQAKSAQTN